MDFFQIWLSFVEGLALIASPCILPVLPLVLSASADGGKKRPFGIITGFVFAFSIFALISRALVSELHIDLDVIKYASLVLLFFFGIMMISSKLSEKFNGITSGLGNWANSVAGSAKDGFTSGLIIGSLIGLVWTPCAGPILAAVLVQIIRAQSNITGIAMIFSFALGAGIPMLIIAIVGRRIMNKLGFFTTHSESIRKAFGVLILCSVAFIASGADVETLFASNNAPITSSNALQDGLATPYPAPELTGLDGWINSDPLTLKSLKGKVVLIDFWTYSCINCLRTLPYIKDWNAKYKDKGLVIIGVHAPEFEFEKNADNVKAAVKKYGITYSVALDSHLNTWLQFNNQYWPAHYLINKDGQVVYTHFGEGKYDITENNIRYLLGLGGKTDSMPYSGTSITGETPETYLGYERAENFAQASAFTQDSEQEYSPKSLDKNEWGLKGSWKIGSEKITAAAPGATLQLHFNARKVFLVLGTATGKPIKAAITLNGEKLTSTAAEDVADGTVTVNEQRLYSLVDQQNFKEGHLEITAQSPGLEAYAFTFGE